MNNTGKFKCPHCGHEFDYYTRSEKPHCTPTSVVHSENATEAVPNESGGYTVTCKKCKQKVLLDNN